jgi:tetratricopeptide (TPR) repeat protein
MNKGESVTAFAFFLFYKGLGVKILSHSVIRRKFMKIILYKSFLFLILFLSFANFAFAQTERDDRIKLFMQGKYDDAATSLKKAVKQNDKDLQALNYLGWTFEKQDKTIEAAKNYKKCSETLVILIEEQLREKYRRQPSS